jgi:hypothetical protein
MIELISLYIGGVSAATGLISLIHQTRKTNSFKTLKKGLQEIKSTPLGKKLPQDRILLCDWLNYGTLILGPLKDRLVKRFLMSIGVILLGTYTITLDSPGYLLEQLKAFEWQDLIITPIVLMIGLINSTSLLMKPEEKQFLAGLSSLHSYYYEKYVLPAMAEFNEQMNRVPLFQKLTELEKSRNDRIRRIVVEELKKSEKMSKS